MPTEAECPQGEAEQSWGQQTHHGAVVQINQCRSKLICVAERINYPLEEIAPIQIQDSVRVAETRRGGLKCHRGPLTEFRPRPETGTKNTKAEPKPRIKHHLEPFHIYVVQRSNFDKHVPVQIGIGEMELVDPSTGFGWGPGLVLGRGRDVLRDRPVEVCRARAVADVGRPDLSLGSVPIGFVGAGQRRALGAKLAGPRPVVFVAEAVHLGCDFVIEVGRDAAEGLTLGA
eukprot:746325-Rhodomonas_salina.1